MKNLTIDFDKKLLYDDTTWQAGKQISPKLNIEKLGDFRPKFDRNYNLTVFTWCFDEEIVVGYYEIMGDYLPDVMEDMPGLRKRFAEFVGLLGLKEEDLKNLNKG